MNAGVFDVVADLYWPMCKVLPRDQAASLYRSQRCRLDVTVNPSLAGRHIARGTGFATSIIFSFVERRDPLLVCVDLVLEVCLECWGLKVVNLRVKVGWSLDGPILGLLAPSHVPDVSVMLSCGHSCSLVSVSVGVFRFSLKSHGLPDPAAAVAVYDTRGKIDRDMTYCM